MTKKLKFLLTIALLVASSSLFATNVFVNNTNDSGTGSLRDAVMNSNNGDTILINIAGMLSVQSPIVVTKDIVIIGPGPIHFQIDHSALSGPGDGAFQPANSGTMVLEGISFVNGVTSHCISTGSGYTGLCEINNCLFEGNNNTVLNIDNGNISVFGSSFIDNISPNNAGVCLSSGVNVKFVNCTFSGNEASNAGGAIVLSSGQMDLIHCTLYENGITMGPGQFGKAIYVSGGTLNMRNNIIVSNGISGAPDRVIEPQGGVIVSLGGNVTNDPNTGDWSAQPTDITSVNITLANMITDGWGLKYFPYADNATAGVDIASDISNLPLRDQRRVWRVMDSGSGFAYTDAGAVEYTPLVVTNDGYGAPGCLDYAVNNTYGSLVGKKAFVFEIIGTAPYNCPIGSSWLDINQDSTIINGFSQNGSNIPGPGTTPNSVTPAYTPIVINDGGFSSSTIGLRITGNDVTVAGVSVVGINSFSSSGIRTLGFRTEVSGCHLGVDASGVNSVSNNVGLLVLNGSAKVGAGSYCGNHYHSNRNVIAGNSDAQISLATMESCVVQGNFIGIASNGMNLPTSPPSTQDTGIIVVSFSAAPGSLIGGNFSWQGNVIADMDFGIYIESENNKIYNNKIGFDYTGLSAITGANGINGITVSSSGSSNNQIGKPTAGNIIGNYQDGIILTNSSYHSIVRGNILGMGVDTLTDAGLSWDGIYVMMGSSYNKIGGCLPGDGNIIGNNDFGIVFEGLGADYDTVHGNYIGITPNGTSVGNTTAGINFWGGITDITIGDVAMGCANEVANNGVGLSSDGIGNQGMHISGNSFHNNSGFGIDLDDNGSVSDSFSTAPNDNNGAFAPQILNAVSCGGANLTLELVMDEDANVILEVFKASDGEEGDSLIAQQTAAFIAGNPQAFSIPSVPAGTSIVVTATHDIGNGYKNTSEFSSVATVTSGTLPVVNISGPNSVCEGGLENYSVVSEPGAVYTWGFPTELPGEYSVVNNITYYVNQTGDSLTADFSSAYDGGANDTLVVNASLGGCLNSDTLLISVIGVPFSEGGFGASPTTCGGTDGYVVYSIGSGTFDFYYNNGTLATVTSNVSGDAFISNLPQGIYTFDSISVSGSNCMAYVADTFNLSDPLPPSIVMGPDVSICEGTSASLSATASGSSGPFTYTWDNGGGTGQTIAVFPISSTTYSCTASDDVTLCSVVDVLTVTVFPLPLVNAHSDSTVCEADGIFALNSYPTGGVWTGTGVSGSNFDPTSSGQGTFTLTYTYTDGNGCTNADDKIITVNPEPNVGNPLVTDVACFGGVDGSITGLIPAGTYTYSWVGPATYTSTSQDITGLEAGTYNLIMTDGAGCTGAYSGVVSQPASPPTFTYTVTDPLCNGGNDGSITFMASGGTSPYQYSIDNAATYTTSSVLTNVMAGSYTSMIIDANGCTSSSLVINVLEPTALSLAVSVTSNFNGSEISCPGNSDGELTATGTGGTGSPTYQWFSGATLLSSSAILTDGAGTYDVVMTDGNGCTTTTQGTLTDPTMISIDNILTTDPSCNGAADGTLEAVLTIGTSGFDYIDWYDDAYITWVSANNPFTGVAAGTYYIEATDLNGCVTQGGSITLSEPAPLTITALITDESCSGYADGVLDTTGTSGGTMPYSLDWMDVSLNSSVGTASPLTGLSVGVYAGVLTDANGCTASDTVTINAGETYNPAIVYSFTDTCINTNSFDFFDDSNVPPSGASSFFWGFANGSPSISSVQNPTGVHFTWYALQEVTYEVTSNAGCTYYDTIYTPFISDTATVALTPTDISCFGAADGSVVASGSGGFGPYQYSFNGGVPAAVSSITGLGAGTVTCYIVDVATGCQSEVHSVGIAEPTQINFTATISDATCGQSNGQVTFQNITGGIAPFTFSVDGSNYGSTNPITGLAPASYDFYLQDANGCVATQNTNTIGNNGNPVPTPTIAEGSPFIVCNDGSNNYGTLHAISNDVSPGTFGWSMINLGNGISANDSLVLDDFNSSGNHYIYLVESNGICTSSPDSVLLSVSTNDVVNNSIMEFCPGSEVTIDLSTAGSIYWFGSNGEIADTVSILTTALPLIAPATYYYELTLGDCIFYDSVTFVEDPDCDEITIVNNAFSPNGDGVNELFIIDANALLSNENKVTIINRWGDIINEYANYDNSTVAWDGTNLSGDNVPAGTYFYVVEIPSLSFKTTGWIQVVR